MKWSKENDQMNIIILILVISEIDEKNDLYMATGVEIHADYS